MEIFRLLPVIHRSSLGELNFTDKKLREKKEEKKKKKKHPPAGSVFDQNHTPRQSALLI